MKSSIILSSLPHTWLFDLDGSIVSHNQYKIEKDKLLPGVKSFFHQFLKMIWLYC